jgi:hypothetical protein
MPIHPFGLVRPHHLGEHIGKASLGCGLACRSQEQLGRTM